MPISEKLKDSKPKPSKDLPKAKTQKKNSTKSSKKPTSKAKFQPKTSIYSLDSWKWNYEDVTKPEPRIVKSLKKRIKHAWEVLKG